MAARQQAAQASLEEAKAGLRQAQAGSTQAESEVQVAESVAGYSRIVAPFDGRVGRRLVDLGSLASPSMPIFVIEDTSRYQFEAMVPAGEAIGVTKQSTARVELDGLPNKPFTAKVAEIEAGLDPSSHTSKVRLDLIKDSGMQSGMFGRAFFAGGKKQALLIPVAAVLNRGQLQGVYVVAEDGMIHWRVITLGKTLADGTEVLSGLNSGDAIVLNPDTRELDGKKTSGVGRTENRP